MSQPYSMAVINLILSLYIIIIILLYAAGASYNFISAD